MERTVLKQVVLEAIIRLRNERTDRSLYHIFQGKRSATSLQDAHFYELESVFGMLPFKKERFEQVLAELEQDGWIEKQQTLLVTEEGRRYVRSPFLIDDLGGELRGYPVVLWRRISLLLQTVICLEQKISFVPVQQDSATKDWVRHQLSSLTERSAWLRAVYQELEQALMQLTEREAILISYRLSGRKTGLSYPQLSGYLEADTGSLQLEFLIAWRKCIRHLPEAGLLMSYGIDIDQSKMTQSAKKTWEMLKQGYAVPQIAERRHLKKSTMEDHLVEIAMYAVVFPLNQFLSEEEYQDVVRVSDRLQTFSLKRIKQELTHEIDYFQIRVALARKVVNR